MSKEFRCSASTINLFLKDPALFVLKHFYDMRTSFNVWAQRGVAVEHGVNKFYEGGSIDEAITAAEEKFSELTFHSEDKLVGEIEEIIPNWTRHCIDVIEEHAQGEIPVMQTELDFEIDGLRFVGYLDYEFKDYILDLKTANKVPHILTHGSRKGSLPAAKIDNIRQQVLYQEATGKPASLVYVSPDKSLRYDVSKEEHKLYIKEIKKVIKEIKNILTHGEEYAINKYGFNARLFNSFYYNEEMINKVKELWS